MGTKDLADTYTQSIYSSEIFKLFSQLKGCFTKISTMNEKFVREGFMVYILQFGVLSTILQTFVV